VPSPRGRGHEKPIPERKAREGGEMLKGVFMARST
jgi:hypothetical protein